MNGVVLINNDKVTVTIIIFMCARHCAKGSPQHLHRGCAQNRFYSQDGFLAQSLSPLCPSRSFNHRTQGQ